MLGRCSSPGMRAGEGVYLKKTFNIALLKLGSLAQDTTMVGKMRNHFIASAVASCSWVLNAYNKIYSQICWALTDILNASFKCIPKVCLMSRVIVPKKYRR